MSELVNACGDGPQIIYNRGKPVAAVIGMESFEAFERFSLESQQPSMKELLMELDALNEEEGDFGEAPKRVDRNEIDLES